MASIEQITIVEEETELIKNHQAENNLSRPSWKFTFEQKIQNYKKLLPDEIRVKDFVITTEDIKLCNNLLTRTVEITKFLVEERRGPDGVMGSTSHMREGENDYDRTSSLAYSHDEFANNLRSKKVSKRIEWFRG